MRCTALTVHADQCLNETGVMDGLCGTHRSLILRRDSDAAYRLFVQRKLLYHEYEARRSYRRMLNETRVTRFEQLALRAWLDVTGMFEAGPNGLG